VWVIWIEKAGFCYESAKFSSIYEFLAVKLISCSGNIYEKCIQISCKQVNVYIFVTHKDKCSENIFQKHSNGY